MLLAVGMYQPQALLDEKYALGQRYSGEFFIFDSLIAQTTWLTGWKTIEDPTRIHQDERGNNVEFMPLKIHPMLSVNSTS